MSRLDEIITTNEHIGGKRIALNCHYNSNLLNIIHQKNITSILLSEANGWHGSNIDFLSKIPNLRGIQIYSKNVSNLKILKELKDLELIGINTNSKYHPNFKEFPKLKKLLVSWKKGTESFIGHRTIKYINVDKFPYENLAVLKDNMSLERLSISSSKLESLSGISLLSNLLKMDLFYCPKLSDISDLINCKEFLELGFLSCKKIEKIPPMKKAPRLRRVVIENCGSIESLEPLKYCESLEELFAIGNTKIEDGDFESILKIPSLRVFHVANKRHYSHSRSEIRAFLESKIE